MAYPNRTDLNNAFNKVARKAAPGQTYGEATKQLEAQKAMPMGASPADARPSVTPGSLGAFNRPTERPQEPITAGVDFGAGMNSIQAGINNPPRVEDPVLERLKNIFRNYPNDELADLIDSYTRDGY